MEFSVDSIVSGALAGAILGTVLALAYEILEQWGRWQRRKKGIEAKPSPQAEALYQRIEARHQRISAFLDNLPTARRKRELLETGQKAADEERWDEAIAAWEERLALELDPEWRAGLVTALEAAYYNRGNTKREGGQHQEAIADYNRAINLNPNNAAAYNNRGVAKADLGQYQDAIANFNKAIALNPSYAVAYNNQGASKMELGQYKEAIADYDLAINFNFNHAAAYNNRGIAKYKLGQYQQAIADYDRAIALNPHDAVAYNDRGAAKGELGQHQEAIADYDKAIELFEAAGDEEKVEIARRNKAIELFEAAGDEEKVEIARRNRESLTIAETIFEPILKPSQPESVLAGTR